MERQSASYNGDTYHLIVKNCNHFCKDICYKLTGRSIPQWVNRLAKIGILNHSVYHFAMAVCGNMMRYALYLLLQLAVFPTFLVYIMI